jgi:hypothetical protein
MSEEPVVICPHCNNFVLIEKIDCAIFRHGVLKEKNEQINPHSSKELCDYYLTNNLIYGCGKPFKILKKDNIYIAEICDYI